MKLVRVISYQHKVTKEVINFVWIASTYLKDPPVTTCIEISEVPGQSVKIGDDTTELDDKLRLGIPGGDQEKTLHDLFVEGEFRSGVWEPLRGPPKAMLPDIPLPDPSEFKAPRASRSLLDSAQRTFRKKPQ